MADSAFEYFLKQYLLTNQTETDSLTLYLRQMRGILDYNLFLSPRRSLLYVTDISARRLTPSRTFEHLSCFLPGLLALGAQQLPESAFAPFSDYAEPDRLPSELVRHLWAAEGLAIACGTVYEDMPCGLGPDEVSVMSETEVERTRVMKENEAARERERLLKQKEKETEDQHERRAPPVWLGGDRKRPKVAEPAPLSSKTKAPINQTESDQKLLWRNALNAWQEGRYDGDAHEYVLPSDGEWHGGVWEGDGAVKGAVPGLRDPPPEAPPKSDMRDYKSRNPSYNLRPEVGTILLSFLFSKSPKNNFVD